jgi:hypothetical protein
MAVRHVPLGVARRPHHVPDDTRAHPSTAKAPRKRSRKVAVHSCPSTPLNAGRELRRGGTVGCVWSSRGAQQGVARCTHAGPWLDSNLFVTLGVNQNGIQLSIASSILIPCSESFRMRFQEDL